jgi:hypothetical protein
VDAEVVTRHRAERQEGKRRSVERAILPGDALYVLGFAGIDPHTGDRLVLRRTDEVDLPFIVSALPEAEVMYMKSSAARWLLNASLAGLVLSTLFSLAVLGAFSPVGYMAAALVGWVFLFLLVGTLLYNDLVFLRHRTDRNRANIDVALKKRADLTGQLEAVVRATAAHEKALLDGVAALRSAAASDEPAPADTATAEPRPIRSVAGPIRALRETYPALKGQDGFGSLMDSVTRIEDEIALMRAGYNDAVERLNFRVHSLPDSLLARAFGFRARPHLQIESPDPAPHGPAASAVPAAS